MLIFGKYEAVIEQPMPVIMEINKEELECNDLVGRYKRIKNRRAQVLQISDMGSADGRCIFEAWLEHNKSKRNEVRFSMHEKQIELFDDKFDVTLDGNRIVLTNINDNADVFKKD